MKKNTSVIEKYSLKNRVAIITGGCGLLGRKHAETVLEAGGIPVLLDVTDVMPTVRNLSGKTEGFVCDITDETRLREVRDAVMEKFGRVDILVNNAANNPKVERGDGTEFTRLENFPLEVWHHDIDVALTGALLCTRVFAGSMNSGVILNIASDLAIIAPDQRIYRKDGLDEELQPVKPVTYSVVKTALIGLTRYCATYYAKNNIRCNALAPGGIYAAQNEDFVAKLTNLIPMGRMADENEYKGAVLFLISDASSYMTGACLSVDGGRTCW